MGRVGCIVFVLFWVGLVAGQFDTFYMSPSGSDTTDCMDSLTPCATFGYVMNYVTENSTVLVSGGDYFISEPISLNNSVTLRGVSGDDVNIICASTNATISVGGPATIEGFTISQCTGFTIAIFYGVSGVLITNMTFVQNEVPIFLAFVSNVTISDVLLFNNSNTLGSPPIQMLTCENITILNSRFIGNQNLRRNPYSEGIVSSLSSTNVLVENCYFEGNTAYSGAGVYTYASYAQVNHCEFKNNHAIVNGSSILVGGGKTNITNCTIEGGNATYGGGIHVVTMATAIIKDTTIRKNYALFGGGIYVDHRSTCVVQDSVITNNTAGAHAGGIFGRFSSLRLSGTNIEYNSAQGNGGGLNIFNCTGSVNTSTIIGNSAGAAGGGIYVDSDFYISGSTISGNTVSTPTENSGIFFASNQTISGLRVFSSIISDENPYRFCCASSQSVFNVITGTMEDSVCNYPACNPTSCPGSTPGSCICPDTIQPIVCNCLPGFLGQFCTIVDQCANASFCDPRTTCSRGNALPYGAGYNFSCSACPPGFNGTGETGCVDFDECQLSGICAPGLRCFNTPGSYQCSLCPPGFTGNGVNCVDVDECLTGNGGCDYHTQCTNTNGSFLCGPCPQGFTGNGYIGCVPQCGNGICEPALGEDCVSCRQDCKNATCQRCGDNYCEASIGENCTSCFQDCGLCAVKQCGGTPTCSGHGECKDGVCICTGSWSGPICSLDNTAINVSFPNNSTNGTDPGIHITPSTRNNQNLTFSLTISRIMEIDAQGNEVYSINLGERNYTSYLVSENDTRDDAAVVTEGTGVRKFAMNTSLDNYAQLEIMIWLFSEVATVEFANSSTQYLANTIKISLQVKSWPFRSLQHSLGVVLDSAIQTPDEDACEGIDSNSDENGNLQWVTINIDGVTMYGQFIQKAVVDDAVRLISFKLNNDGKSVTASIPHFWESAVIDPSYSVLLGETDEGCKHKKDNAMVIVAIAVVVPILGLAVIIVIAGLVWRRVRLRWQIRASQKPSPRKKPISMGPLPPLPDDVTFDRVTEMHTTTAVGTFSVQL